MRRLLHDASAPKGSAMSPARFAAQDAAGACAVVDLESSEVVAFTGGDLVAFRLARLLNVLAPSPEQLAALFDDSRMARTITLQHDGVCWRCGRPMPAGGRGRWNGTTRLVRHVRSCPAAAANGRRSVA